MLRIEKANCNNHFNKYFKVKNPQNLIKKLKNILPEFRVLRCQ